MLLNSLFSVHPDRFKEVCVTSLVRLKTVLTTHRSLCIGKLSSIKNCMKYSGSKNNTSEQCEPLALKINYKCQIIVGYM